jgi:hypothetical protein
MDFCVVAAAAAAAFASVVVTVALFFVVFLVITVSLFCCHPCNFFSFFIHCLSFPLFLFSIVFGISPFSMIVVTLVVADIVFSVTRRANRMPPKKNTKHKDPPPAAEEAATDPANQLAEPPSTGFSSGDSSWGDDDSDDDDWDAAVVAASTAAAASAAAVAAAAISSTVMITMLQQPPAKRMQRDHRTLPWDNRREFFHADALQCIGRDFTGLIGYPKTPLHGSQFKLFFRLSRGRFQVLMEDLTASNYGFFKVSDSDGFSRTSIEARLLLPLKTLA